MNPFLDALKEKPNSQIPLWLMRQAGRYLPEYRETRKKACGFMELCLNEALATEVTLQPLKRFDFDAAILFCDILVIPHVLGQHVQILEKQGPRLGFLDEKTFFEKAKDINLPEALSVPLKVIQNVRRALPSIKSVIGFAGSPWTIGTYMLEQGKSHDFSKAKKHLEEKSPLFVKMMPLLEDAIGTFLIEQIKAGVDVIQIFDSWAKAVPMGHRKEWIVLPIRRLIARIQKSYPGTPIIYYGRGIHGHYPEIADGFSNVAFGVDETVSLSVMKNEIQSLGPIQGNLSPQVLREGGQTLKQKVVDLLQTFQGTPYIFNLGHGIVPQTPIDHVSRLIEWVRKGV